MIEQIINAQRMQCHTNQCKLSPLYPFLNHACNKSVHNLDYHVFFLGMGLSTNGIPLREAVGLLSRVAKVVAHHDELLTQ